MTVASLTRDNAVLRATIVRLREQREGLRSHVDELESEVAYLESEGLQPLVDRLMAHLVEMRRSIEEMEAEAAE